MNNGAVNQAKQKLPPAHVREHLSRDVHVILSTCIHQFKADQMLEEKCFDVDAVIAGRSVAPRIRYEEKVAPAAWAAGRVPQDSHRPLTMPGKGNFIPMGRTKRA